MVRKKSIGLVVVVGVLFLVSVVQAQDRRDGGPGGPPQVVVVQPQAQPPVGPGPSPMMKEFAEQLRARAREAQELADRLRRQADELDQRAKQQMDRGRGPQQMGQMPRELAEIKEAIGRAEREGRRQEADELRSRAEQLMGRGQPMPSGPRMEGRQEAERLDQSLRDQGPRGKGESGGQMPPEIQDIRKAAEQAEREGRMDDARRMREKAETIARQGEEQSGRQSNEPRGPRMGEPQEVKGKIERLRDEAQKAKEQGRVEDADRQWKDADRLEQQMREQGPRKKGESGRQMPPEVQEILKSAEQAAREGRMDDARRQREKAEIVARQIQEQKRQGPEQPGRQLKDEIMRSMEELKKEIGRLWQAVNEMRNRPKEGRPM